MLTVTLLQSSTGSARLAQRGETQRDSSEWCRERIRCPETVSDGFSDVKWQLKSTRIPPAVPVAQCSAARAPGQLCEAPGLPRGDQSPARSSAAPAIRGLGLRAQPGPPHSRQLPALSFPGRTSKTDSSARARTMGEAPPAVPRPCPRCRGRCRRAPPSRRRRRKHGAESPARRRHALWGGSSRAKMAASRRLMKVTAAPRREGPRGGRPPPPPRP